MRYWFGFVLFPPFFCSAIQIRATHTLIHTLHTQLLRSGASTVFPSYYLPLHGMASGSSPKGFVSYFLFFIPFYFFLGTKYRPTDETPPSCLPIVLILQCLVRFTPAPITIIIITVFGASFISSSIPLFWPFCLLVDYPHARPLEFFSHTSRLQ
jgi:hypothetical protein